MPGYSIKEISTITKGRLISVSGKNDVINHLLIDSRKITVANTSLFFAIVTKKNNGHKYISELHNKGVRNFVVSEMPENIEKYEGSNFLDVKNTLDALQAIAIHHRKQFDIPVIGITGSNGKTIVKEWIFQLLSADKNIVRSPKSFNSQIGVPLSVWQMQPEHELAIIEAGISEPEEMKKLQNIIQPTIGIFTNIGSAHEKNFINNVQKTGEKLNLFTKTDVLIYCADSYEIQDRIIQSEILKQNKFFKWGCKNTADLVIKKQLKNSRNTTITGLFNSLEVSITIPFTDNASIENAIHCWALMLWLGYSNDIIASRMRLLTPVAMRLELKAGINNCSIINDSYSSDLNSLSIALDFMNQQNQHKNKTVILSDILQSALDDNELYGNVSKLLNLKGVTRIIGIGPSISDHDVLFSQKKSFYKSTDDFLNNVQLKAFNNETILIKGARVFEFEQISRLLQQKTHETVLEINLNALIQNLDYFKSKLKKGTKIMTMVKALSYGSGGFEIANVLQYHNIDYLAVAYADEGIELRKAGITRPIMVMNPEEESFDLINKYDLEPEIYSFRTLKLLIDSLNNAGKERTKQSIHIKIDTGMHRLGFAPGEINTLLSILKENDRITVKSVFTHLAVSENPEHDDFTLSQIKLLKEVCERLKKELPEPFLIHVLNSAGISRFKEAHLDMIRLGIGLYGISFYEEEQQNLQNVSTLKTIISQIKTINKGETVNYGRVWIADKKTTIAILPVGYADGLSRRLSDMGGYVYILGKKAMLIGSICMDMCTVDITDIDAKEGDTAFVFNDAISIKNLAKILHTIPYEILTSVSGRVKRVYYYE
ncbi:MAG: bifunctional UDP-N-acetylmuramoyl-tripeptide:D-alanyl-D-alanine ligase/alanine racemase [Bacteroidales bacterium]|jgi:alanine racemase|nr:bifunctional UDP-N-acetylmuramoyl-tripeptide:D-alanyl-D-alanine ligase/alanine racemase [Bacteroidales bacterium]MDD4214457.1 bifunctional UDP-N-acetylmuramoyl-tripeptide:D-alanyl-D-alanine ligase/alanine racemase [Bacteroidales bacterium]